MPKIKGLKFGDIVINHWAGESNPKRTGVFIRYRRLQRNDVCQFTDTEGKFWDVHHDKDSKFERVGSVILADYRRLIFLNDENK